MSELRLGHWIQTITGKHFSPLDPRVEDISIHDIAWSLAKLCRFNGHTVSFYSVAQHCVIGSELVECEDENLALAFLLHDASEAYLGDLVRPLKSSPEFAAYLEIEKRLQSVIETAFRVSFNHPIIQKIDLELLATERRDLMGNSSYKWPTDELAKPLEFQIKPWGWKKAAHSYIRKFITLSETRTTRILGF